MDQQSALSWTAVETIASGLISDDLYQHAFPAPTVELTVKDLFPGAEIQFALGDGDDNLPAHNLALHVSVRIVLPGAVMFVLRSGRVRRQLLEPHLVVMMQPAFVVIDKNGGSDVHRVYEYQALLHIAPFYQAFNGASYVDEATTVRDFKPEMFRE